MLGWTPKKGQPTTGQISHPRVHLPNQRLRKPDRLSCDAHKPDKLSQGEMQNTLDKKGLQNSTKRLLVMVIVAMLLLMIRI